MIPLSIYVNPAHLMTLVTLANVAHGVLFAHMGYIAVYDFRHQRITNRANIVLLMLSGIYFCASNTPPKFLLFGGLVAVYIFAIAFLLAKKRQTSTSGMLGGGDIKMLLALIPAFAVSMSQAAIDWEGYILMYTAIAGLVHVCATALLRKNSFGPGLVLAFYAMELV